MTTCWWSILAMLKSIIKSIQAIILALNESNKNHLILDQGEQRKVKEIIALLEPFKDVGEQVGKESDVTLSYIVPTMAYLKKHLSETCAGESKMITDMTYKTIILCESLSTLVALLWFISPVCSLICLVRSHFYKIYFFSTEIPLI